MKHIGILVWTAEKITNFRGELSFDPWIFIESQLAAGKEVVFVFPNVSASDLGALKSNLAAAASAESIDMTALLHSHKENGEEIVAERWEFGFTGGPTYLFVRIFAMEFFREGGNDLQDLVLKYFM